jgi:hypothetical protein
MFYLPEAQNPIPPPPCTHCIRVYTVYLFTQGRRVGGVELNQREGADRKNKLSKVATIVCHLR